MAELALARAWASGEVGLGLYIGCQAIWKRRTDSFAVVQINKLRSPFEVTCDGVLIDMKELVLMPPHLICSYEKPRVKEELDQETIEKGKVISSKKLQEETRKTHQANGGGTTGGICEASANFISDLGPPLSAISPFPPLQSGNNIEMLVVCADSPSHIVARPLAKEGEYQKMLADLASEHSSLLWTRQKKSVRPPNLSPGSALAAMVQGKGWLRAEVVAPVGASEEDKVDLFLYDVGKFVSLHIGSVRPLPDCYRQLPRLAVAFHLPNIIPAGGKEWSKSAKEMLASTVMQQDVEVEVLGSPAHDCYPPQLPSHPASMCIATTYASDPVAPSVIVRIDVADRCNDNIIKGTGHTLLCIFNAK